jgi:uncharacterized membrane protein YphA (DoxX/SURF4 family)
MSQAEEPNEEDAMTTTLTARPRTTSLRRARTVGIWALQVALAVQFAAGGLFKLTGDPQMIEMFTQIGAGTWLRYLVGALELAGAAGLLIPRLAGLAALGLVVLMVGATITNLLVLHTSPALPVGYLLAAGLVAWSRRAQIERLIAADTR